FGPKRHQLANSWICARPKADQHRVAAPVELVDYTERRAGVGDDSIDRCHFATKPNRSLGAIRQLVLSIADERIALVEGAHRGVSAGLEHPGQGRIASLLEVGDIVTEISEGLAHRPHRGRHWIPDVRNNGFAEDDQPNLWRHGAKSSANSASATAIDSSRMVINSSTCDFVMVSGGAYMMWSPFVPSAVPCPG